MKLLFICSQNLHRSKTAEIIFREKYKGKHEVKSAGFWCEDSASNKSSFKPQHPTVLITRDLMQWPDIIFVFEQMHIDEIRERFPAEYLTKKIINLEIPDIYSRGDLRLRELLLEKVPKNLK